MIHFLKMKHLGQSGFGVFERKEQLSVAGGAGWTDQTTSSAAFVTNTYKTF